MCEYEADAYGEWQRSTIVKQLTYHQVARFLALAGLQALVFLLKVCLHDHFPLQDPVACR